MKQHNRTLILAVMVVMALSVSATAFATHVFSDVDDNNTHADNVHWAAANDIVLGYDDGTFKPGENIRRDQAASMFKRYHDKFADTSGPQGPAGPKGDTGATGPAGADGKDGAPGAQGPAGTDGADGTDGRAVNYFNFGDTYCYTVANTPTFDCYDSSTSAPSSNEENFGRGWAYYEVDESTLTFYNNRNFASCFEYRVDGQLPTDERDNFNPAFPDGLWDFVCVSGGETADRTVSGDVVEVRLVFGAEGDERFNWETNIL